MGQTISNRLARCLMGAVLLAALIWNGCSKTTISPVEKGNAAAEEPIDTLHYLALGDSYTIGEGVAPRSRWPEQLAAHINEVYAGDTALMLPPRIIARTGWTAAQLLSELQQEEALLPSYDLVSLLIGVNNQYQRKPFEQFEADFQELASQAIALAGGQPSRVAVLSIPDYAYTPFGQQSASPDDISDEINKYNGYIHGVADSLGLRFFDITPISRLGLQEPALIAPDNLHPSTLMYRRWVELIEADIAEMLGWQ